MDGIPLSDVKRFADNFRCLQPRLANKFRANRIKLTLKKPKNPFDYVNRRQGDFEESNEINTLGKKD